ncbi:DUF1772 domain-containing protein [Lysobacter korlensis]|uniref:DUF1772 domain-containing protein n=1 Tax=Lysobacter korlensis TaxID=553636 RepID=A0ABV6RXD0_9GAMM
MTVLDVLDVLVVVAVPLMGLAGGTFWAFSTGVMPGLRRTDDDTFVTVMRSINRAVLNPLFLVPIFLSPLLLAWAAFLELGGPRGLLLLSAALVYFVGAVVVTLVGNVPLNNALDGSVSASKDARAAFERRWNILNGIRSGASVAAITLAIAALTHGPGTS